MTTDGPDAPVAGTVRVTRSAAETEALGASLARGIESGDLPPYIALRGALGAGKTVFVRGVASVLAPGCAVRSPTFAVVNEYRAKGRRPLFHFDMYRIESEDDLLSVGYDEYPERGVCAVEWSERIPYALPDRYVSVSLAARPSDPNAREIRIDVKGGPPC